MFTGASYWLSAGHYPPCKHSVARTPDSKFLHAIRTTNRIRCWASRCRRTSRCRSTLVKRCSRTIFFSSCKINFISSSDCTFWPHNRFIHANRLGLPISRVSSCATILSLQVSMWKSQCECLNVKVPMWKVSSMRVAICQSRCMSLHLQVSQRLSVLMATRRFNPTTLDISISALRFRNKFQFGTSNMMIAIRRKC